MAFFWKRQPEREMTQFLCSCSGFFSPDPAENLFSQTFKVTGRNSIRIYRFLCGQPAFQLAQFL
ncbi:MAG: hypothetical protein IPP93_01345 [Chitinophagaceae bacterium]|nr:hypothetical protein [Chitinophagaceae bacterium]